MYNTVTTWSKEEEQSLIDMVKPDDRHKTILLFSKTSGRSYQSVSSKFWRIQDELKKATKKDGKNIVRTNWTKEEETTLLELTAKDKHKSDFDTISTLMGRTVIALKVKRNLLLAQGRKYEPQVKVTSIDRSQYIVGIDPVNTTLSSVYITKLVDNQPTGKYKLVRKYPSAGNQGTIIEALEAQYGDVVVSPNNGGYITQNLKEPIKGVKNLFFSLDNIQSFSDFWEEIVEYTYTWKDIMEAIDIVSPNIDFKLLKNTLVNNKKNG